VSLVAGGADAPRPLAQTPLVLVAWRERGDLIWRDPAGDTWRQLHDALAQPGWSALGGSEDWGPVKLGQTSPALSNSGAQALALMAYSFYGRTGSLSAADAQSPELAAWLATFQSAVPEFGESTGDLMTTMLQRGPSTYDVALVYESTAIEALAAPRTWGALQVYYPPATLVSDHPFAILDAPWASAAERDGARLFRDFLLARESQERALSYGLRPATAAVSAGALGAQSPFVLYRDQGLRAELPPAAETPAPEAIEALLAEWERQHGR
jgi:ABC-type Fe3+ transport system substrate-binding protein